MNGQNNQSIEQPPTAPQQPPATTSSNKKLIIAAIIAVVITALVVGFGVYAWQRFVWKTYSFNEYQFDYPGEWIAADAANGAEFYFSGELVATLRCPIREIGYPGWEIESQMQEPGKGKVYPIELQHFKDLDRQAARDFSLILINRTDFLNSCELGVVAGKNYDPKIAERIYSSTK